MGAAEPYQVGLIKKPDDTIFIYTCTIGLLRTTYLYVGHFAVVVVVVVVVYFPNCNIQQINTYFMGYNSRRCIRCELQCI